MAVATAFGRVLRRLRKQAGLSQEQLGLDADLMRNYISILELGQQQPTITTLFKLATSLKRRPSEWAAAGLKDTLLRCEVKPEVVYGNEKAVQPRVQA